MMRREETTVTGARIKEVAAWGYPTKRMTFPLPVIDLNSKLDFEIVVRNDGAVAAFCAAKLTLTFPAEYGGGMWQPNSRPVSMTLSPAGVGAEEGSFYIYDFIAIYPGLHSVDVWLYNGWGQMIDSWVGSFTVGGIPGVLKGILSVDTFPVKGEIFVDGLSAGIAPISVELPPGGHVVRFADVQTDEGTYAPIVREASYQVIAGMTSSVKMEYKLKEVPEPEPKKKEGFNWALAAIPLGLLALVAFKKKKGE